MLDDFFARYQSENGEEGEEQAAWATLRARLDRLPPETRDAAYRAVVVHWFDAQILEALLQGGRLAQLGGAPQPAAVSAAPELYHQLQSFSSVEAYADRGHAFQKTARRIALEHLWRAEETFVRAVSARAAAYFDLLWRADVAAPDVEVLVEWLYHLLIADESQALEQIDHLLTEPDVQLEPGLAEAVLRAVEEQANADRLTSEGTMLLPLWRAQVCSLKGDNAQVRAILEPFVAQEAVPDTVRASAELLLGDTIYSSGEYATAKKHYEQALRAYERLAWPEDQVLALLRLGDVAHAKERFGQADALFVAALERYMPELIVPAAEGLEPASDLNFHDAHAWHWQELQLQAPSDEAAAPAGEDEEFFPEQPAFYLVERSDEAAGSSANGDGEAADEGAVWPVAYTGLLAEIWLKLGYVALARDEYTLAAARARLSGEMAESLGDLYGAQRAVQLLGSVADLTGDLELGRWRIALQEEILRTALEEGDEWTAVESLLNLASSALQAVERQRARTYYKKALELAERLESPSTQAMALEGLGRLSRHEGDYDGAEGLLREARHLLRRIDDQAAEADILVTLGDLALARYRHDEARRCYEGAQTIFRQRNLKEGQSVAARRLGSLALDRFQYDEAERHLQTAIALARELNLVGVQAEALVDLGSLNKVRGRYAAARQQFEEAIRISQALGRPALEASSLAGLGRIAAGNEQFEEALDHLRQAEALYEELDNPDGRRSVLMSIADVQMRQKEYDGAIAAGQEAVALAERFGERGQQAYALMQLGLAYLEAEQYQEAIAHLRAAVEREPHDSTIMGNLGWALYEAGNYRGCLDYCYRALELDPANSWHYRNIGHAYLALGEPDKARAAYRQAIELRYEGEHFKETIKVIEKLLRQKPDTPCGEEMLQLFRRAQAELDGRDAAG